VRGMFRDPPRLRVLRGRVSGVDVANRCITVDGRRLPYDVLVLATGASHGYFGHEEWEARPRIGDRLLHELEPLDRNLGRQVRPGNRVFDQGSRRIRNWGGMLAAEVVPGAMQRCLLRVDAVEKVLVNNATAVYARVRRRRRLSQHLLPGGSLGLTWAGLTPADRASFAGALAYSMFR
jgi:hypothetical protein